MVRFSSNPLSRGGSYLYENTPIARLLSSENDIFKAVAADNLYKDRPDETLPIMFSLLKSDSWQARILVLSAIRKIKPEIILLKLVELLNDPDEEMRSGAAFSILEILQVELDKKGYEALPQDIKNQIDYLCSPTSVLEGVCLEIRVVGVALGRTL